MSSGLHIDPDRYLIMYIPYNPNPDRLHTTDCVIRALTIVVDKTWTEVYDDICLLGRQMSDMPNMDRVWGEYLRRKGFVKMIIPDTCPYCYTIQDFANDHPDITAVVKTSGHVVAVRNGNWYDASNSAYDVPIYYWCSRR